MLQPSNKTAIALAWNFFKGNYALNFAAVAILIVLSLLGVIPVLGMLFIFGYSIVSLSVQIYFARGVERITHVDEIAGIAAHTRVGELLSAYLAPAAGAFLGLFGISVVFMMLFGATVSMNMDVQTLQNGVAISQTQMMGMVFGASGIVGLILILIAGMLFYFFPAVMGEVMMADTFADGFKRVFLLFSPTLWKGTFKSSYFVLVFVWSLILMGVGLLFLALSASLVLLPLVLVGAYLVSLYNAAIYLFAARLAR